MPKRIQRKRTKGWTMPPNTVYVGRPSKWGNPFIAYNDRQPGHDRMGYHTLSAGMAVISFAQVIETGWCSIPVPRWPKGKIPREWVTIEDVRRELRGKDLACGCPLVDKDGNKFPCHADVLLEIANCPAPDSGETGPDAERGEKSK